jgi:hypothetical protein
VTRDASLQLTPLLVFCTVLQLAQLFDTSVGMTGEFQTNSIYAPWYQLLIIFVIFVNRG